MCNAMCHKPGCFKPDLILYVTCINNHHLKTRKANCKSWSTIQKTHPKFFLLNPFMSNRNTMAKKRA